MIQAMATRLAVAMLVMCVIAATSVVQAQDRDYRKEVIRFSPGNAGATVRDQLRGFELVDYIVRARSGQRLGVVLRASNPSTYFNILEPGERDVAIYNSSSARNSYSDVLRRDGEYRIRVYLIRAAARRGERTEYTLSVDMTGAGTDRPPSSGRPPQQETYWEVYVANGPHLNIRERPSYSARVATRLNNGTVVRSRTCETYDGRRWCEIARADNGALLGWADARFLRHSGPPHGQPPSQPPGQASYWEVYVANGPHLNVRERPSYSARVATRLRNGTVVRSRTCENAEGQRWCEVERADTGARLGWADARYLRHSGPPPGQAPTPPSGRPPAPPHGQATYWEIYVANGSSLNIRERPSPNARITTRLRTGTIVRDRGCETQGGQRWCAVENAESGAFLGWAAAAYLRQSRPPQTQLPSRPHGDALVPGTNFHATGELPCARTGGEPLRNCSFGVTRRGGGSATVTVFWPGGGNRVIRFERGEPVDFDWSQADGNKRLSYRKAGDRFLVRIGDEQFEIIEAIVFGG